MRAIRRSWRIVMQRRGADEIVLLDITATHEGRGTLLDTVKRAAAKLFVPFTVGGGIRSAGRCGGRCSMRGRIR